MSRYRLKLTKKMVLVLILVGLAMSESGCIEQLQVPGTYYKNDSTGDYITLNSDYTYHVYQHDVYFSGTYYKVDGAVNLRIPNLSFDYCLSYVDNSIRDQDGDLWIRE